MVLSSYSGFMAAGFCLSIQYKPISFRDLADGIAHFLLQKIPSPTTMCCFSNQRSSAATCLLVFVSAAALAQSALPTVTLYPPVDPVTTKYDEGKATFSFKFGLTKAETKGPYDLGYGFLSLGDEDWFTVNIIGQKRTVIRDLGELRWQDSFATPVLEPLPPIEKGEHRNITVDSSGDTHEKWAATTSTVAKVATGHIYLVHVKTETDDYYAMFRVEEFKQQTFCKFSWRLVPAPSDAKP